MALSDSAAAYKDALGATNPPDYTGKRKDIFQHRHFAFIAGTLKALSENRTTCEFWADCLETTNAKFDRRRFIRACGFDV